MRTRHPLAIKSFSFVWIAIGIAACAATGPPPPTPVERERARTQFEQAQELLAVDDGTATQELERFLRDWPRSELADDAALELARRAAADGQYDRASRHLVWATRLHPRGDRIDEIQLLLAEVESELGHGEAAYRSASRIRLSKLVPDDRHRVHVLLADLAGERGDHVLALRWWARAYASAPDQAERERLETVIDERLAGLSESELTRAARKLEGRFPALRVHLRLAALALEKQDEDAARRHLQEATGLTATAAETERRLSLEERLTSLAPSGSSATELPGFSEVRPDLDLRAARGTLGVVLPLSGAFAGFGEECLRGVLMAAGAFGPAHKEGVRVLVRDSGGTAEGAAAAVEQLASEPSVSAIVGPLLASEAEGAAAAADARGIPLLALTGRDDVARGRPYVFRVGREPRGEIQVLVDHAVRHAGLGRFAILYPDDSYGRGARDLFWDEVEAQGGRIVGVQAYEPGVTDFATPIRNMVGFVYLSEDVKEALEVREDMFDRAKRLPVEEALALREEARAMLGPDGQLLPPVVEFDALFLPDSYEQVTLIAPQLAFHEVNGVRLLGSAGWNHPDLLRIGGDHMDHSIFTETFYPDSDVPYVSEFTRGFESAYAAVPGSLAALSFDASNLVIVQLARGLRDRDRLRQALLDVRAYPGVSGIMNIRADGTAQKRPYLLGVEGRRIVALED